MTASMQINLGDLCRLNVTANSLFILKASMISWQPTPCWKLVFRLYFWESRSLQVPRSRTVTLKHQKVWNPSPFNLNSFIIAYNLVATSSHLNTLWTSWKLFQPCYIIAKKTLSVASQLRFSLLSTITSLTTHLPFQKPTDYCCQKKAEYHHQSFTFTSVGYLIYLSQLMEQALWSWQQRDMFCRSAQVP